MTVHRATATLDVRALVERGLRCRECEARVCSRVEDIDGVLRVECDPSGSMRVDYDSDRVTPDDLDAEARDFGVELESVYEHGLWSIGGLDCPDCALTVARSVEMLPGVVSAELNFASAMLLVEHEFGTEPGPRVMSVVRSAGHTAEPVGGSALAGVPARADRDGARAQDGRTPVLDGTRLWTHSHRTEMAVIGSGTFIALGWMLGVMGHGLLAAALTAYWSSACFLVAVVFGETLLLPRALASIRARRIDMNVLMTTAIVGALAIGQIGEAATVVFLFAFGGWLEARTLSRTRSSIRDLMALAPHMARVRRDGAVIEVVPTEVALGETLLVRPGDRIALDGVVKVGVSAVDESAVTGEPVPAAKHDGDAVFAGTLNGGGLLEVQVTARAEDSTMARIVYLVEEAQASRAPSQLLIDRFSRIYTPVVIALAVAVAALAPLLGVVFGPAALPFSTSWSVWFYRGLVVLVAACPCALVISTPVTFVSAIARAARDGVLVKGGAYLELAARLDAVAFDKTGTLTQGRPEVSEVTPAASWDKDTVLGITASLEAHSTHPLAGALLACAASRGIAARPVSELEELPGRGMSGIVDGTRYMLVSPGFAEEIATIGAVEREGIRRIEQAGNTALVLIQDGEAIGFFGVSDPPRPRVGEAVRALVAAGISHTVLLTGDNERTAAAVASHAGLSAHEARLLPADKTAAILRLKERFGAVAMVGDGINDAPALAVADIGIAMGAAGSDTAIETADVALLSNDLAAVPRFLALGKRTVAIVRANLVFSVITKVAVLVAAILGHANMWLAVFADTGVALLVILNGMRLLRQERGRAGNAPV